MSARTFPALDGLRGVAAIAVVIYHCGVVSGTTALAPYGYLAVDLFFVMSGFVIGNAYETTLQSAMSWRRFMLIRIARFYPCLFVGCVLGVASNPHLPAWTEIGQFLLVPNLMSVELFPLNAVFWSLLFELFVNGLHAAVLRWLSTPRLLVLTGLSGCAFIVISLVYGGPGVGWGHDSFLAGLARVGWGYGLGLSLFRLDRLGKLPVLRFPASLVLLFAAVMLTAPNVGLTVLQVPLTIFVGFPLLVWASINARLAAAAAPLLTLVGGLSYPLYAIHLPILHIIGPGLSIAGQVVAVASVIALSAIVERVYDAPVRRAFRNALRPCAPASPSLAEPAAASREATH